MSKENIFKELQDGVNIFDDTPLDYIYQDRSKQFTEVVATRRSVRKFSDEKIPEEIVQKCLDLALLAPNSSNLQPWEFIRVVDPNKKNELSEYCFSQNAATSAAELIVCVAHTNNWKKHCDQMMKVTSKEGEVPKSVRVYYTKIAPLVYSLGFFNMIGFIKKILYFFTGLIKVTPREMTSFSDLKIWAIKTTALGCENLMLAFRAFGYDSCPMEGFDSKRVKKLCGLGRHQHPVMIIGAGRRVREGVYGPQIRFPREQFIREIR